MSIRPERPPWWRIGLAFAFAPAVVVMAFAASAHPGRFDARKSTFLLDAEPVTLRNGVSSVPAAPGSAIRVSTRYFGDEATGDLTKDGRKDVAFIVTQDKGGSGLFYYAVVAICTGNGYKTTNAFYIGDRIAPLSTVILPDSNELQINFADRRPGEPMTAAASVKSVLLLEVTPQGVLEGVK